MIEETPCRVPVFQHGRLYAHTTSGSHDWRLWGREPNMVRELYEPKTWDGRVCEPGEKHFAIMPHQEGWVETWYCTRCRTIETRRVA